jgi:hypothetical protein
VLVQLDWQVLCSKVLDRKVLYRKVQRAGLKVPQSPWAHHHLNQTRSVVTLAV